MGQDSKIEWTNHTFNPWIGCSKVSPGCQNCYAESENKRRGWAEWGPSGTRRMTSNSYWHQPFVWNKKAADVRGGVRVFCGSLCDVFEGGIFTEQLNGLRNRLWSVISATPHLTWLLLTKRPENVMDMVPSRWHDWLPGNVWIGTSVENQEWADKRIPELMKIPAVGHFLSCEPLIDKVNLHPEIVEKANLTDKRYPIKGMNVWTPYGWKIMQAIDSQIRREFDSTNHQGVCFPLLIPEDQFAKEKEHIKGFDTEVFWVTTQG